MFELTEEHARILREFLGSEWVSFMQHCGEFSALNDELSEELAEEIYKKLGGTD